VASFRSAGQVRAERRSGAGDRIIGIVSPGEGITIYPIQSPALKDFEEEPERWLRRALGCRRFDAAALSGANSRRQCQREPGKPRAGATVIAEHDGNIDQHQHVQALAGFHRLTIDLESMT